MNKKNEVHPLKKLGTSAKKNEVHPLKKIEKNEVHPQKKVPRNINSKTSQTRTVWLR